MRNLFNVEGKVALVSGGSSGIGAMMARGLVANGAKVIITARRPEPLAEVRSELSKYGECSAFPCDMTALTEIQSLVASIAEREEKLDILINNAGANWFAPVETVSEADWESVMNINLKSMFFAIQQFLPLLRASATPDDPARIINIASVHGLRTPEFPTYAYSASKSGAIHLTRHLAMDLANENINVNAIAPGLFESDMTKSYVNDPTKQKSISHQIPLGRIGKPEDIAGAALYLSAAASSWITGQTLVIDGGLTATP